MLFRVSLRVHISAAVRRVPSAGWLSRTSQLRAWRSHLRQRTVPGSADVGAAALLCVYFCLDRRRSGGGSAGPAVELDCVWLRWLVAWLNFRAAVESAAFHALLNVDTVDYASAMRAVVSSCVCVFVCPSRAGIVSKRLNV